MKISVTMVQTDDRRGHDVVVFVIVVVVAVHVVVVVLVDEEDLCENRQSTWIF